MKKGISQRFDDWSREHVIDLIRVEAGHCAECREVIDELSKTLAAIPSDPKLNKPSIAAAYAVTAIRDAFKLLVDQNDVFLADLAEVEKKAVIEAMNEAAGGKIFEDFELGKISTDALAIGDVGMGTPRQWLEGLRGSFQRDTLGRLRLAIFDNEAEPFETWLNGEKGDGFKSGAREKLKRNLDALVISFIHSITNRVRLRAYAANS